MAKPIEFRPSEQNPRDEIQRRLADAPIEHAEALLACYKLIEEAHNSGTLELLRGLLAAQDTVITHASKMFAAPEAAVAIRNGFVLIQLLGRIDPQKLSAVLEGVTAATAQASGQSVPSLFSILGQATSPDTRRALQVGIAALEAAGKVLKE
ncbi:MAG: DUF1641 domain-containing protein [Acidobacteriaceae bacterium]